MLHTHVYSREVLPFLSVHVRLYHLFLVDGSSCVGVHTTLAQAARWPVVIIYWVKEEAPPQGDCCVLFWRPCEAAGLARTLAVFRLSWSLLPQLSCGDTSCCCLPSICCVYAY